ncbi:type II toxin-antitoxin system VapC family toxin [Candidatus Mycobacterium methanotrophicum]|uniref:Ribonuclease VapC n=1 Tax=Candidatus Mycobacterium methanotrophicum TaxID=2943498 RepID=A0ABY4QI36_9MYCO|nr:type II toxin-antitoxin system VapC family toxin [Candidatus Mycobacterium methanotrophicum]UQX10204.1 type II toxin-antitoxin system VapC family toxin [Candidatus Mycobacterium methanotrophicum]
MLVVALTSGTAQGDAARAALSGDDGWLAPAHMPGEVLRTLHKAVLREQLELEDAEAAADTATALAIEYVLPDALLLRAAWAWRHNISIYDGLYVAVAAERSAAVITVDRRLANATDQLGIPVAITLLQ